MVRYISLGGNCSIKEQLIRNGIECETLPFDWIKTKNFYTVIELLSNNFEGFLDNLNNKGEDTKSKFFTENEYGEKDYNKTSVIYENKFATFYHDFHVGEFDIQFNHNIKKYQRRIERLYNILKSDEKIIFIRNDVFIKEVPNNALEDFECEIRKINKNINYQIKWILNPTKQIDVEKIKKINNCQIWVDYKKPKNWWHDEIDWEKVFFN